MDNFSSFFQHQIDEPVSNRSEPAATRNSGEQSPEEEKITEVRFARLGTPANAGNADADPVAAARRRPPKP